MKYLYLIALLFLFSCKSKDEKMCACLESGEKLNDFSSSILVKEISESDLKEMEKLKNDKKLKCKDYQTMSGEEMLKKKASCE
jgi:hypothetical protein